MPRAVDWLRLIDDFLRENGRECADTLLLGMIPARGGPRYGGRRS